MSTFINTNVDSKSINIEKINIISKAKGVDTLIVRALAGLSKSQRSGIRNTLIGFKTQVQSEILTYGLKQRLLKRKELDWISTQQGAAQKELSKIKAFLGSLNIGPDVANNKGLQTLIKLFIGKSDKKGSINGSFRDADNVLNTINFNIDQAKKAANLSEVTAKALNSKIDEINSFIAVLDAIDTISKQN